MLSLEVFILFLTTNPVKLSPWLSLSQLHHHWHGCCLSLSRERDNVLPKFILGIFSTFSLYLSQFLRSLIRPETQKLVPKDQGEDESFLPVVFGVSGLVVSWKVLLDLFYFMFSVLYPFPLSEMWYLVISMGFCPFVYFYLV